MNFAMQPVLIIEELRRRGIQAAHLQYLPKSAEHRFNFRMDKIYRTGSSRIDVQMNALKDCLDEDYDIYHFWQRSLIFRGDCSGMTGLDLPLIKSRGKARILHRFTGFDLRLPRWDREVNPYSPFHNGHPPPFDEKTQLEYIDFLHNYVDQFLVQDPELQQFMPEAKIIPRCLDLDRWKFIGVEKTDCPLIVHAPTNRSCKGSVFILKALDELKEEGLKFKFQAVENMPHDQAQKCYEKADIIIDQILIGATGVLTLEAWALGKPVVVYLREDLFRPFYGGGDLPVANANPDTIKDTLRALIKDYEWRQKLSRDGRATVEKYHDVRVVTDQCLALYEDVLAKPVHIPENSGDIVWLQARIQGMGSINEKKKSLRDAVLARLPPRVLRWLQGVKNGSSRTVRRQLRDLVRQLRGRLKEIRHSSIRALRRWQCFMARRFKERSTWFGLCVVIAGLGFFVSDAVMLSVAVGVTLAGLILIVAEDEKGNETQEETKHHQEKGTVTAWPGLVTAERDRFAGNNGSEAEAEQKARKRGC